MVERTFVAIKPDGVQRGLIGEILRRFENTGLKIIAMKMVWINHDFAAKHYFDVKERHGERVFKELANYITEGPVIAMVIEGIDAIANVRKLIGSTYPNESMPGTIRGDYSHISKNYANTNNKKVGNLVHASSKKEDAEYETKLWFKPEELHTYKTVSEIHTL